MRKHLTVTRAGAVWFNRAGAFPKSLALYDPESKSVLQEIWTENPFGMTNLFVLRDADLSLSRGNDRGEEFGLLLRFELGSATPILSGRVDGCWFANATLSSDQKYALGVCVTTGQTEWNFGATLKKEAIVIETRTLRIVGTVPMHKSGAAAHAIHHEKVVIRLVLTDAHRKVLSYSLSSSGDPVTVQ